MTEPALLPQYAASLMATTGALAAGIAVAWTNLATSEQLLAEYEIETNEDEYSWIGSLFTLGAATVCVPIGVLADAIGRKRSMMLLAVPFVVSGLLLCCANSLPMLYVGRYLVGMSGGAFCVTAPMYTGEIADKSHRGVLGTFFQFMLVVGILISFSAPAIGFKIVHLSGALVLLPVIFFAMLAFAPESPTYYLKKAKDDEARESLKWLRGAQFNVEPELTATRAAVQEAEANKVSFLAAMKSKATKKALLIGLGLMLFQQFSGVNVIIFYATPLFEKTALASTSNVVVGIIQVVAVIVSAGLIDKAGRRLLLAASIFAMMIMNFVLGIYFYFDEKDPDDVSSVTWIPLLCVCVYIFMFNMGFGPIPWLMLGEIFSTNFKGTGSSLVSLFSWMMAFVVTKIFPLAKTSLGGSACFIFFSLICVLGLLFCAFCVIETKGKTLTEIQAELENDTIRNP